MNKTDLTFLVLLGLIAANWVYDLLELSVLRDQEEERDDA